MVKRNLIANYLGQGWIALMGLAFIPLYIKYLGIEAYGLIGLFVVLQAWLALLDMGMTPTLGREMARFTGGGHSAVSIRDLLRSVEWIAAGMALLLALGIWAASGWLASDWLRAEKLSVNAVAKAFAIMGVVTALRFVEGIYRNCIMGLQRQALFNAVNAALATVRGLGAVGILIWVSPTIEAFFIWHGVVSFATLLILAGITYRVIPYGERGGRFSLPALRAVWRFAGGAVAISMVALILTGIDRILLSTLLTLSEYGSYMLAIAVASAITMFVGPVVSAVYPRMCELIEKNDKVQLVSIYHHGAQLVTVVAGSAAILIAMFSKPVLLLWTRDVELANQTADLLSVLVLVQLVSALMYMPHYVQLAHGWTSLELKIYLVALVFIVPLIFWSAPRYGAIGTAWVLLALGLGQLIIGLPLMFRRIIKTEKREWFVHDIVIPLTAAAIVAGLARTVFSVSSSDVEQLLMLATISICTIFVAAMAASYTRQQLSKCFLELRLFILGRIKI